MTLRKWYWLSVGLLIGSAVVIVIGNIVRQGVLVGIGWAVFLVGGVMMLRHNKCPCCGEDLGRVMPDRDSYCPKCGRAIDWDGKQGG